MKKKEERKMAQTSRLNGLGDLLIHNYQDRQD